MRTETFDTSDLLKLSQDITGDGPQVSFVQHPESTLKPPPRYGVCLWWSDRQPSWIHPDDVEAADEAVPGDRVFRRDECENFADRQLGYSQFEYGEMKFRALPAIWLELKSAGYELGDFVQIKSQYGKRESMVATISEIKWNRRHRRIEYVLKAGGRTSPKPFTADEFQPAVRLESHLNARQLELASKSRLI